jgi:hypothetical protein
VHRYVSLRLRRTAEQQQTNGEGKNFFHNKTI